MVVVTCRPRQLSRPFGIRPEAYSEARSLELPRMASIKRRHARNRILCLMPEFAQTFEEDELTIQIIKRRVDELKRVIGEQSRLLTKAYMLINELRDEVADVTEC